MCRVVEDERETTVLSVIPCLHKRNSLQQGTMRHFRRKGIKGQGFGELLEC